MQAGQALQALHSGCNLCLGWGVPSVKRSSLTRSAGGTSPVKRYLLFSATRFLCSSLSDMLLSVIRKGVNSVISLCSFSPLSHPSSGECSAAGAGTALATGG